MCCRVTKPKTVEQWVSDGGKLWEASWIPQGVPQELITKVEDAIELYIMSRRIGVPNDTRFQQLWDVNLIANGYRFWNMLEAEEEYVKTVDLINTHTISRTYESDRNGTTSNTTSGTGSVQSTGEVDQTNTRSNDTTVTYGRKDSITGTDTTSGDTTTTYGRKDTTTGTTAVTTEESSKSRQLASNTPQSNVASSTQGLDVAVTWTYATGLQDSLAEGSATSNTTNSNDVQASGTDQVENSSTVSTNHDTQASGSDNTESSGTDTVSGTNKTTTTSTTQGTDSGTSKDTETGTEQVTETGPVEEILEKWYSYLLGAPSPMKWLLDKIEPLLYGFYDDYEEA